MIISSALVLILGAGIGTAIFSSYGQITGYATVNQALTLDIMGSSNDVNYTMTSKQGELKYSPKIKLVNSGTAVIPVNLTNSIISGGTDEDVKIDIVNVGQNETLENPINVPPEDEYIYIRYQFSPAATVGEYVFELNAIPY